MCTYIQMHVHTGDVDGRGVLLRVAAMTYEHAEAFLKLVVRLYACVCIYIYTYLQNIFACTRLAQALSR